MRKISLLALLLWTIGSLAEQPLESELEVTLHDPWRADPMSDAAGAVEEARPYLLRLQILGEQPIPGIRPKEEHDCWVKALEVRQLTGFTDIPDYRGRTANAVLRIYAEMFNYFVVRELRARGQSPCDT